MNQGLDPADLVPYPIYRVCLVVKDDSTSAIDKCYKLYYYSHETKPGDELYGWLYATNLYRNEAHRDTLLKYIQLMTRFNVFLELGIRRKVVDNEGTME